MMWQEIKNLYHLGQAIAANMVYKYPSRKLKVIGVTGTDGKTTTASLIYHILNSSGKKTALISTVGAYINGKVYDVGFHVTNPAAFPLQKFFKKIKSSGHEYVVLEVTSHGLDQNRIWGIPIEIAVLTNLTHEHLDYHGNFQRYMNAKLKLFQIAKTCILNMDEAVYPYFSSVLASKKIITYSLKNNQAILTMETFKFRTELPGDFNKLNCLAAIGAVQSTGAVSDREIKSALATFTAPTGRMEVVQTKPFRVIIDFAHTPNAFAQVLPEIKKTTTGRLIHVFGSAGKRDQSKRPLMGTESAKSADIIILTAEDPRDETVEKISWDITQGFGADWTKTDSHQLQSDRRKQYTLISDRKSAIETAISIANPGDTVLFTGKAHEKSLNYGRGEEPWDEFKTTRDALRRKLQQQQSSI